MIPSRLAHLIARPGPTLTNVPPQRHRTVIAFVRLIGPLYRRYVMRIPQPVVRNEEMLTDLLGDSDVLTVVAFRHPSADDPQLMYEAMSRACRRAATRQRQRERQRQRQRAPERQRPRQREPERERQHQRGAAPAARARIPVFLYGRGVPVWAGALAAWIIPRIGALSVFHATINRESHALVAHAFAHGRDPIVLAPEGQVTYHNYRVAPILRGTAALAIDGADTRVAEASRGAGARGAEASRGAGAHGAKATNDTLDPGATSGVSSSSPPVVVVPVSLEFRYPDRGNRRLHRLLASAERRLGITAPAPDALQRVLDLWDRLLGACEADLACETELACDPDLACGQRSHRAQSPSAPAPTVPAAQSSQSSESPPSSASPAYDSLTARCHRVVDAALTAAEQFFGLSVASEDDPVNRIFRVRNRSWQDLFPGTDRTPPHTRLIAEVRAHAARTAVRWLEIADLLTYLDFSYLEPVAVASECPAGSACHARLVEYALSLIDAMGRQSGKTIGNRPSWLGRRCTITYGAPIPAPPPTAGPRRLRIHDLDARIAKALSELSRER